MGYFETYKSRLNANGGNVKDSVKNATIDAINKSFTSSLGHLVIKLNGVDTDSILIHSDKDAKKFLLFKPGATVNRGDVALVEGENHLILDVIVNEIHPKAEIKFCNQTFTLSGAVTKTLVGYDDFGKPIYSETEGTPTIVPCIVEKSVYIEGQNTAINLSDHRIKVTLKYQVHNDLLEDAEFEMFDESYKIVGVDKTQVINGVGLLIFYGERVVE
jgi:hypothetical protein